MFKTMDNAFALWYFSLKEFLAALLRGSSFIILRQPARTY